MNRTNRHRAALLTLIFVTGCAGGSTLATPSGHQLAPDSGNRATAIKHIVLVIQENRTFDNLFATFPGADGATQGVAEIAERWSPRDTAAAE